MLPSKLVKQTIVFFLDAFLIAASLVISYALRFNTVDLGMHWGQIGNMLPLLLTLFHIVMIQSQLIT